MSSDPLPHQSLESNSLPWADADHPIYKKGSCAIFIRIRTVPKNEDVSQNQSMERVIDE